MIIRVFVLPVLLIGTLLTGCVVKTGQVPLQQRLLKADSMTRGALFDKIKAQSKNVTTLMVKGSSLKVTQALSAETFKDFFGTGIIVVDRPEHIRLEISEYQLTIADMVSDGKQYKISLPHGTGKVGGPPKFGVAEVEAPAEGIKFPFNLRPSHILDALFVDGEQYFEDPEILTAMTEITEPKEDGVHSIYRIDFTRLKNSERIEEIWIDRSAMMEVTRKISYMPDGKMEADIRYSNYDKVNNVLFPKTIVINRPVENYVLEMKFEKMELNSAIEASTFNLERPQGVVDVDLNTGKDIKP